MKKGLRITLAVLCAFACFALVACASAENDAKEAEKKVEETTTNALTEVVAEAQAERTSIEEALGTEEKAALAIAEGEGNTIKYMFVSIEEEAESDIKKIETKIMELEGEAELRLNSLKEKGVEDGKVAIQYLDMEGNVVHEKIFE